MKKYTIKFMPEYNATSLWAVSDSAYEELGINIKYEKVKLSSDLHERLVKFDERIFELVDWDNPGGESPLTAEERTSIWDEGQLLLERIRTELGDDYEVVDELGWIK